MEGRRGPGSDDDSSGAGGTGGLRERYQEVYYFNSSPNDKLLNVTKLKAFAADKLNVAKMMISLFDRVEKTVGKGENAACQHFLFFPQCFPKALFFRVIKSWDCVVKS